jgi:hypothetical protein
MADFYGKVLVESFTVTHTKPELDALIQRIRTALLRFDLKDFVVAIERCGRYHHELA